MITAQEVAGLNPAEVTKKNVNSYQNHSIYMIWVVFWFLEQH